MLQRPGNKANVRVHLKPCFSGMSWLEGQRSDTSFIRVLRISSLWEGILWRDVATSHTSYKINAMTTKHDTQSWVTWSHENHISTTDSSHVTVRWQPDFVMWQPDCHVTFMWQPDSAMWQSCDSQTLSHDCHVTARLTLAMHTRWEFSEPAEHISLSALQSSQGTPDRHTTQQATAAKQTVLAS